MIQGPGNNKWERHASVDEGPQTDFTHMGECKGKRRSWTHVDSVVTCRVGHETESCLRHLQVFLLCLNLLLY